MTYRKLIISSSKKNKIIHMHQRTKVYRVKILEIPQYDQMPIFSKFLSIKSTSPIFRLSQNKLVVLLQFSTRNHKFILRQREYYFVLFYILHNYPYVEQLVQSASIKMGQNQKKQKEMELGSFGQRMNYWNKSSFGSIFRVSKLLANSRVAN